MTALPSTGGTTTEATSSVPASYEDLRQRHVRAQAALLPQHLERISWSADHLAHERRVRLRDLLRVSVDRSPWHRKRLAGIDPDRFDAADLPSLPTMTKDDLMAHFDDIVTDPRLTLAAVETHLEGLHDTPDYLLEQYHAIASGGSSGTRGVFLFDWAGWATKYLGWIRYLVRYLGTHQFSMAVVAAGKASHGSRALLQTFTDAGGVTIHSLPITLPFERIVAGLNALQPDVVCGYPTAVRHLAAAAEAGSLTIAPQAIATGGEPLLPEIRAAAEAAWGVAVHNWWLSSEGGPMGISCGWGSGMHLSEDLLIVEPVDIQGEPVPAGVRSAKVYLTNLFNTALPLIRYELTDEVTLLEGACRCGSAHRRVADVEGRLDDSFVYPAGVVVHPHVFRSALGRERGIIEYQVRQTPHGAAIHLRLAGRIDLRRLRLGVVSQLASLGLHEPVVTLTPVQCLERQATGKLKRFVPDPTPGSSLPT
jgi:phenylacetate-coenzyme A ligase PaaK-like adenylate-forming protein